MRSASHTKPRLSWYSTGLAKRPFSIDGSYSLSATFSTSAAERAVKPRSGFMNFWATAERALEALVDHLERLLVGALALGLDGLCQRLQLAAGRGGCCAA